MDVTIIEYQLLADAKKLIIGTRYLTGKNGVIQLTSSKKRFKKITEHRKQFIQNEVDKYSKQIGISDNQRPKVIFTTREVKDIPIELTKGRRSSAYHYRGVCYYNARTIFINARILYTTKDLRNTIVHELVHYRFNYLNHGNKFIQRIKEILKGRQFPIKDIQPIMR